MPAFNSKLIMIPLHSFLGTIWRIFYWLSYFLILCFDLWSVRWKDWGLLRQNRGVKKRIKMRRQSHNSNEALRRQETASISDTSGFTNSVNLIPLLLFHSTYFLITFISFFNINYRPVVTRSNIGLHNAIHHNYFFTAPEIHYIERKYVNRALQKDILQTKGGFNCGFWGQGRGPFPGAPTPGFFHKILNFFTWREDYFGTFFTQYSVFKSRSKITEYGVGGLIMDRFFIEIILYFTFALLGLILGGPAVIKPKKEDLDKLKKKIDEENGKRDSDKQKPGKDNPKPPKVPEKKLEVPKNSDIPSVTKPGLGSFFACARFLTGFTLGMNLIFSGVLEILNHTYRKEYNVPFLSASFGVACLVVVLCLLEYLYVMMVSMAGEAPKEIDDMASIKSGSTVSATRNQTPAPSRTSSDDSRRFFRLKKRAKKKIGFFLRGSVIFNNVGTKGQDTDLKPGQKLEKAVPNLTIDTLSVYYMCVEYSAANMKKSYS
jgi:hypothetical protein